MNPDRIAHASIPSKYRWGMCEKEDISSCHTRKNPSPTARMSPNTSIFSARQSRDYLSYEPTHRSIERRLRILIVLRRSLWLLRSSYCTLPNTDEKFCFSDPACKLSSRLPILHFGSNMNQEASSSGSLKLMRDVMNPETMAHKSIPSR
jgi:hypothetical protein